VVLKFKLRCRQLQASANLTSVTGTP
jgi:hypothetical protein